MIYCAFLKPSPALETLGHGHLLGKLAYDRKTWANPMSTVLASVAFLLLLDASLLSQAGITQYSQQLTLQHSTFYFYFGFYFLIFLSLLQSYDHHMKGTTRPHLN